MFFGDIVLSVAKSLFLLSSGARMMGMANTQMLPLLLKTKKRQVIPVALVS